MHIQPQPVHLPLALVEPLVAYIGVKPGVVRAGQLAHGVRPALEEEALVQQGIELRRVIESGAGEHDEVVAARDHTDGVQL